LALYALEEAEAEVSAVLSKMEVPRLLLPEEEEVVETSPFAGDVETEEVGVQLDLLRLQLLPEVEANQDLLVEAEEAEEDLLFIREIQQGEDQQLVLVKDNQAEQAEHQAIMELFQAVVVEEDRHLMDVDLHQEMGEAELQEE
jgi:hypothetical protein